MAAVKRGLVTHIRPGIKKYFAKHGRSLNNPQHRKDHWIEACRADNPNYDAEKAKYDRLPAKHKAALNRKAAQTINAAGIKMCEAVTHDCYERLLTVVLDTKWFDNKKEESKPDPTDPTTSP